MRRLGASALHGHVRVHALPEICGYTQQIGRPHLRVDGYTPLDIAIQWNARAAVAILLRAGAGRTPFINEHVLDKVLPHQATAALHVRKVIDGGGFKKYEQDHLATLTNTFEPKFTMLPKELVRHVVSFWLHAGYY